MEHAGRGELPGWGSAVPFVFLVIGLSFLLFSGILTITADGITRTLKQEHSSLIRRKLTRLSFDEMAGIAVRHGYSKHSLGVALNPSRRARGHR